MLLETYFDDLVFLQWDGKLLPALPGKKNVNRVPVIAPSNVNEQLLKVSAVDSGTQIEQGNVIFNLLNDWCITEKVQTFCCDTTATNTGVFKGACFLLKHM